MIDETILRLAAVKKATGLSRTTIYIRSRAGTFPAPVSIGGNRIGWRESEINSWIAQRSPDNERKIGRRAPAHETKPEPSARKVEWEVAPRRRGRSFRASRNATGNAQLQGKLPF